MIRLSDIVAAVFLVAGLVGLLCFSGDRHPDLAQQIAFQYSLITLVGGFCWLSGVRMLAGRDL